MTSLLSVENIYTSYGLSRVLFGISLEIAAGECVSLLGRNGVGKTTTMRSIMGLTPPSSGRVLWRGCDITGWAPHRVARAGIGFVPEERRIFAELSVWENLEVGARAARRPGYWTIATVGELFPVLRERRGQRGGFLSGGEQQMLTIARALTGNPQLMLLDEPSEGLAPLVVDTLRDKIGELKTQGLTILLAEQRVDFALALADRVYVLEKGAVRFSGTAAELRCDKALLDRLLSL
ncbi:MAG: ABC transporter ATP-binding protein [Alphaproteobacteria bacterium]|nr:ABC transporter ATP-binding protein [Alphaproteobacteria bacterium]MBV9373639.1 ABC transporter ATP-binding protein [Alphaproteobacteria bacterium]